MRITLCAALLIALAVPAMAQEDQLNQVNITCYLVHDESIPTGNSFVVVIPRPHREGVGFLVACIASDSVCKNIIKYLRHSDYPVKVFIEGRLGLSASGTLSIYVRRLWLIDNN